MSVRASVAIAVAERVERTGGPRAGLVAWRALASGASTDADARGRALAGALRCAVTLRDRAALTELGAAWTQVDRGLWVDTIVELCKRLVRAGLGDRATALAAAEARRHRTARALYLHARCRELDGEVGAPLADAFREAAERAANEGAGAIEQAARVRRAVALAGSWTTLPEALAEAGRLDLGALAASARISVAAVLLASPSRFVRAGAIDALGGLLEAPDLDDAEAWRALVVAAAR